VIAISRGRSNNNRALLEELAAKRAELAFANDLSSVQHLAELLSGCDVAVVTLRMNARLVPELEQPILEAALRAQVRRFVPDEFGVHTKALEYGVTALHSGLSPFGWSPLLSPLTGGRSLGVAGSLPARTKRFFSGDVACVSRPNESCDEPEPVAPAVQGLPERRRSTLRRERYPVIPRARI
jgi:hypothetical protein